MNQSQNLRDDSEIGFKAAVHMLAATFKEQLDLLKPKLVQAAAGSPKRWLRQIMKGNLACMVCEPL